MTCSSCILMTIERTLNRGFCRTTSPGQKDAKKDVLFI